MADMIEGGRKELRKEGGRSGLRRKLPLKGNDCWTVFTELSVESFPCRYLGAEEGEL